MSTSPASRGGASRAASLINITTGTHRGLSCPYDGTRLEAIYSTDLSVRVRCTHGMLRGGTFHEFSLPAKQTLAHYEGATR